MSGVLVSHAAVYCLVTLRHAALGVAQINFVEDHWGTCRSGGGERGGWGR